MKKISEYIENNQTGIEKLMQLLQDVNNLSKTASIILINMEKLRTF